MIEVSARDSWGRAWGTLAVTDQGVSFKPIFSSSAEIFLHDQYDSIIRSSFFIVLSEVITFKKNDETIKKFYVSDYDADLVFEALKKVLPSTRWSQISDKSSKKR